MIPRRVSSYAVPTHCQAAPTTPMLRRLRLRTKYRLGGHGTRSAARAIGAIRAVRGVRAAQLGGDAHRAGRCLTGARLLMGRIAGRLGRGFAEGERESHFGRWLFEDLQIGRGDE